MQKKIVKNNQCAVILGNRGWYSNHGIMALIFDPCVVDMILRKVDASNIYDYCYNNYENFNSVTEDLSVVWVPNNSLFRIHSKNDKESIEIFGEKDWIKT